VQSTIPQQPEVKVKTRKYVVWLAVIFGLPYILIGLVKAVMSLVTPGMSSTQGFSIWVERMLDPADSSLWIILAAQLLIAAIFSYFSWDELRYSQQPKRGYYGEKPALEAKATSNSRFVVAVACGLICAVCLGLVGWKWFNNKDQAIHPNLSTTFAVADTSNPPDSLQRLLEGAVASNGEPCVLTGGHDVPSCVTEETLPSDGWENRSASLAGALRVMRQTSGESQKVELLSETAVHIYPEKGETIAGVESVSEGYWTAIRDGSGKHTPAEAVVEWDGRNPVTTCEFEGDFELNRALRGDKMNSLNNIIMEQNPGLRYHLADVYGYCDHQAGSQPVIVVPMYDTRVFGSRHVDAPAGVLLVRGSPSGDPQFQFVDKVEPGSIPGPVYPLSFAEMQRQNHEWAAGRKFRNNSFGFKQTTAASQDQNATEFLLRSRADGRTYWVTPLTPRGSDSELVLAYSVIPADTVSEGHLNEMTIYVFSREDERVVNLDQMERDFRDHVSRQNPGFFSAGGSIQEFTPGAGNIWRAFGVLDGDPRFVIEIDRTGSNRPIVTELYSSDDGTTVPDDAGNEQNRGETSNSNDACQKSFAEQSDQELLGCTQAALNELEQRGGTAQTPETEDGSL